MMDYKPFSEVIESSLFNWLIQSWQWNVCPSFGTLIVIDSKQSNTILCGVVYQVQTGSMDPIRYPFPYKKTQEELLAEQPQIFEFLKTTFSCLPVGYINKGTINYLLPPYPPEIHSFASIMPVDLCKQFFYHDNYLHLMFGLNQQLTSIDELLLAMLKQQSQLSLLTKQKINRIMQTYSLLIGNDYRRLKLFLSRTQSIIDLL